MLVENHIDWKEVGQQEVLNKKDIRNGIQYQAKFGYEGKNIWEEAKKGTGARRGTFKNITTRQSSKALA